MLYGIERNNGAIVNTILTENKGFMAPSMVGINGYTVKTWKTLAGAERYIATLSGKYEYIIFEIPE